MKDVLRWMMDTLNFISHVAKLLNVVRDVFEVANGDMERGNESDKPVEGVCWDVLGGA